ncbi:hypothetical protein PAPYR_5562 [Paratrimastix pyriformis]|uniref:Glycosyltransferase 61 catalytic domain-containing protein n=1 Tax=Paratrimastix pyriformis TaxID=342808 RepID=A0ABQ8UKY4_9EUKA|nr:hypothetical protein PAPYR_5562 [Paratrimastix pyriformis]
MGISPDIDGPYTSTHYFRTRVGCTEAYFHDHPEIVASPGILRGYTFDSPVVLMRTLEVFGLKDISIGSSVQNVPRLMMVRETLLAHPEMRIIISYWDRPFFREYLDLLGLFPQAVLIPDSVHVLAPQIIVPAPVPCGQNVPRLLLEMRDVIYAAMAQRGVLQETQPQPQREIVVIRRGGKRRVINHAEVMEALREQFGDTYPVVEFTSLSLIDTINMFRRARVIVGPHGAGLTNILYTQPGTPVVEFMKDDPNACYASLAANLGLPYYGFRVPGANHENSMTVDVDKVIEWTGRALRETVAK